MPELPEVETVRRSLSACLVGRRILSLEAQPVMLRLPLVPSQLERELTGQRVSAVRRRAKYLLLDHSSGRPSAPAGGAARRRPGVGAGANGDGVGVGVGVGVGNGNGSGLLLVHLGMSGRLRWQPAGAARLRHDHVVMRVEGGFELCFHDPRRFGRFEALPPEAALSHPALRSLGVEPLDPSVFNPGWLHNAAREVQAPIKNFLMDAKRVVGVGNIYASEALFAAGIHPRRAAGSLSLARCGRLVEAVRAVLEDAIAHGGTTLRDFADATGSTGLFRPRLQVYGRTDEACLRCRRTLLRRVMAGRSTFYCPGCQH